MPTYDFNTPIDLKSLPASVLLAMEKDPAAAIPGAPPNFGRDVVPHYFTTTGYIGSAARAYPIEDEATRNSVENAERMRTECAIMECLESRQRATALLGYHIVPEDERSSRQQDLCRTLTRIISRIPRFVEYRKCLLEALWYGKYAIVNRFSRDKVGGHYRTLLSDWAPRHGDKLLFRYSDNTQRFKEGQLGIRVHANFAAQMEARFPGPYSQWRKRIEPTQYGLCYWFNDYERETMVVHKHMIEDGPWQDPRMMGRVMGVGIRDRIYWTWYAMQALLQDLLTYSNRAALGVRLWRYPSGNDEWKKKVEESAKNAISNGVADILFPVEPNEYASLYGVEQIEPGTAGAQLLAELIERFFLKKIKKYILGQLLTSEAEATGLGSGVAQAHLATFSDIVQYDAANLQETLTEQLVRKIQKENAPKSMGVYVRMVLDTDTPDTEKRLAAIQAAYQMDVPIKIEDIYQLTGLTKPQIGDATVSVSLQQEKQQRQQNQMMMEQQAMMAASQGAEGEGMEGAPEEMPPEEEQPVQATMDVSPENVEETQGPAVPVDGELEEKASLDQPAQGSPWNGFWESLFDTIQGKTTEAPPADEEPERYDDLDEQTGVFQEAIDDYIHHERSVEDFKEDLAAALDEQWQLSEDLESAFNRQDLTDRLNDAIDFETLTAAIDREFDAAYLRDSLTALLAQRMTPQVHTDARQSLLDALNKQFGYADVERYSHAWTPYKGPRGGKGWRKVGTGEVRYQEKSPDRDPKPETELRHHRWKKNGNGTTPRVPKLEREDPYVGFDLDGTLARDDGWQGPGHIGEPIPRMVAKVKWFLHKGIPVRIITARLGLPGKEADISHRAIKQWCKKHIGQLLKVQAHKTPGLVKLYDDKAEGVEKNTGKTDDGQNSDKYTCTAAEIEEAVRSWSPPTPNQIKAGNFYHPRVRVHGIELAIESPAGTSRKPGWKPLSHAYGYISRIGNQSSRPTKDTEKLDVFLGPTPDSEIVFVIDQEKPSGDFDEHKAVLGATSESEAKSIYLANYPSGWRCGVITSLTVPQFKAWLDCGDLTKRVAKQVSKYMAQYESDPERYARKKKFNPLQKTFDFDAPKPAAPAAGQSEPGSPWVRMKGDRGATYWYNKVTNPQNDPGGRKYQEEKPGDDDTGEQDATATAKPAADAEVKEPTDLRRKLTSISNRADRKPYEPISDTDTAELIKSGLVHGKGPRKGKLTDEGYRKLRTLDQSGRKQELQDAANWDNEQEAVIQKIENGEPVTQKELDDYALAGTEWEQRAKVQPAETKEPWQMTPKEYVGDRTGATEVSVSLAAHPGHVKRALAEGKPVPDTVLQAYRNNGWAANELEKRNSTNPQEPTDEPPSTGQENPANQGQDPGQDQNQGNQGQSAETQGESEGRAGRVDSPKSTQEGGLALSGNRGRQFPEAVSAGELTGLAKKRLGKRFHDVRIATYGGGAQVEVRYRKSAGTNIGYQVGIAATYPVKSEDIESVKQALAHSSQKQPDRHILTPEAASNHLYSLAHDMFASYYGGT